MQQPMTKSPEIGGWSELSSFDSDSISLSVSRLVEPMDSDVLETKGSTLLTSLPERLWFNIQDVDDQETFYDYVENNGGSWYTGDGYFLNPTHEYDFYVSSFDSDLSSVYRSVSPTTTFYDSVDEDDYYAYTRDDIVGYYYRQAGSTGGDYNVQMHHIYSAIFFEFSGVGPTGAVIQSVNLKNIKRSGTMSYDQTGVSWTATGSVSNLTNNVNYTITNGTSNSFSSVCPVYVPASAITSSSFLEVKMSYLGQVFTLTQSLSGDIWNAGYKYTYRFGFNGFTNNSNYSLVVSPSTQSSEFGSSVSYTASLKFSYGGNVYVIPNGVSSVIWQSGDSAYATLSSSTAYSSGQTSADFSCVSAGTVTVYCDCIYAGVVYSGSATLVVTPQYRVNITPSSSIINVGNTTSFNARLQYRNSSSASWTIITSSLTWTWSSTDTSVAEFYYQYRNTGYFEGVSAGSTYVNASTVYNGVTYSGSATLAVQNYYHLVVSPSSQSVDVGSTCTFTAAMYNGSNYLQDVTSSATWTMTSPSSASTYVINNGGGSFTGKQAYSSVTIQAACTYNGTSYTATGTLSVNAVTGTFYRIVFDTTDTSVYWSDAYFSGFYVRKGGSGYLTPVLQQRTMVKTWQSGTTFTWVADSGSAGNWTDCSTSISRNECTWSTANSNIAWFNSSYPGRIYGSSSLSSYPSSTTFRAVYNGTSIGSSGKNPDGSSIASDNTVVYVLRKGGSGNDNGD